MIMMESAAGRDEQMDAGVDCDWTPPTEAEMKVIQAKKERSDKISKLMGDYLLKGYRMLATSCSLCGTILLRDKQQRDYCVACNELDTEHAKDDPALSAEAARSQVREQELVRTSLPSGSHTDPAAHQIANGDAATQQPLTITNVCSVGEGTRHLVQGAHLAGAMAHRVQMVPSHALSPPPANPQATVLPQTVGSMINLLQQQTTAAAAQGQTEGAVGGGGGSCTRVSRVMGQSLDSVLDKLVWASEELKKSNSVETCTQLCRLIKACADAADSLKSAAQN